MTAPARTKRPAAAKTAAAEPPDFPRAPATAYPGPPLPRLELACDNGCGATFAGPDADGHADLRLRAYADGWVTDGGWTVCPACAHGWHLHEPSKTVASITGILAGLDADAAPDAIDQIILVHDEEALAGMWVCPRCDDMFSQFTRHSPCFDVTAPDPSGPGTGPPPRLDGEVPPVLAGPGPEAPSSLGALSPEKERTFAAFLAADEDSGAGDEPGSDSPSAPEPESPAATGQAPAAAGDQDSPGQDGHPAPSGPGEPDLDDPALDRADGGAES